MKLSLVHRPSVLASASPYRLLDEHGQEIAWANDFLDAQHIRQLSPRSLRAYAYDLLHFARWCCEPALPGLCRRSPSPRCSTTSAINWTNSRKPTPQTVNHRLTVIRCLYRFHYGQEIPAGHSHFQRIYTTRCPVGYGRPHRAIAFGLRLKQPRRVIQPLSAEQVAKFWASFRTFRDLAVVGLMLLDGLRSCEILTLQLEDLKLADAQLARSGQGQEAAHLAAARRDHGSAAKLSPPGTAADQLSLSVRFAQRPSTRSAYDAGRTPLAVPPSSIAQSSPAANPHRFQTYLRSRHGAGGHLPTRAPAPDGTFADSHHHALCPTCSPGRLARICPRRRQPCAFDLSEDAMSQPRQSLEQIFETHVQTLSLTLQPFTVSQVPIRCPPLRWLSSRHLPGGPPTLPTPSRSPYAGLVPLALRVTIRRWATIPASSACSVFAVCSTT